MSFYKFNLLLRIQSGSDSLLCAQAEAVGLQLDLALLELILQLVYLLFGERELIVPDAHGLLQVVVLQLEVLQFRVDLLPSVRFTRLDGVALPLLVLDF